MRSPGEGEAAGGQTPGFPGSCAVGRDVGTAKAEALIRAKARLDRVALYPRPVSLRGVRVWIVPWLFRLPWFRRFDGYSAHWTIFLRSRELLDDERLVAHELCHVWQMQHHPVRMPLSYLLVGYAENPYERAARRAVDEAP